MKRRRNSTEEGNKEAEESDDEQIQISGYSFIDLPSPILVDILLKLSVKSILICKCVCKTWLNIILDPQFGKLQFEQAEPCPLLRTELDVRPATRVSRTLYLVEPENFHNFDLGKCFCYWGCRVLKYFHCDHHLNMKLETKLKIPLRNPETVLNGEGGDAQMGRLPKGPDGVKRKPFIKVTANHQRFKIANSCNGFLCLSEPLGHCDHPIVVCNPITGEYINLPVAVADWCDGNFMYIFGFGLGFSPRTNQYKVVRVFDQYSLNPITGQEEYDCTKAEIHTLGSGSWESMGDVPYYKLEFPTYLNGALYWFHNDMNTSVYIVSFNLEDEQFHSVPFPSHENGDTVGLGTIDNVSMGVLLGCLCICDASNGNSIHVWIMMKQSWTKMFSIDTLHDERLSNCLYLPMNYLKDWAVLMFNYSRSALVRFDLKRPDFKYLKVHGIKSKFEAFTFIPSFISLKDAVVGDNVAVLNINSRCAEFRVQGETKPVFLVEEYRR